MPSEYKASEEEICKLIEIIEEVAKGNYSNDIMEFTKPGHAEMIQRVAEAIGMMMVRVEAREVRLEQLVEELRDLNRLLEKNTTQTVIAIAHALGARDKYTEGHARRVSVYSERLARKMGLPEKEVEKIRVGGVLHDIGKIGFSDRIFSDEDISFSEGMVAEIHKHPEIGVDILEDLTFLGPVLDYVHYHHESLDGTGYPDGLKGEEIPLGAKIISVADCFDAVTTDRSYQRGRTMEEAFAILKKIRGKNISSELVEAFIEEVKENGML
ncbi:MAG: HD domain-containing protein [Desulfobacteraceae bacterium]|nr:HD domain-containing protein [Desulfobacteraceae bacterium]